MLLYRICDYLCHHQAGKNLHMCVKHLLIDASSKLNFSCKRQSIWMTKTGSRLEMPLPKLYHVKISTLQNLSFWEKSKISISKKMSSKSCRIISQGLFRLFLELLCFVGELLYITCGNESVMHSSIVQRTDTEISISLRKVSCFLRALFSYFFFQSFFRPIWITWEH